MRNVRSQTIDHINVVTGGVIIGTSGRIWLRKRQRLLVASEALMLQGFTMSDDPGVNFDADMSYADMRVIAARGSPSGYVAATLLTSLCCHFPFHWRTLPQVQALEHWPR